MDINILNDQCVFCKFFRSVCGKKKIKTIKHIKVCLSYRAKEK